MSQMHRSITPEGEVEGWLGVPRGLRMEGHYPQTAVLLCYRPRSIILEGKVEGQVRP